MNPDATEERTLCDCCGKHYDLDARGLCEGCGDDQDRYEAQERHERAYWAHIDQKISEWKEEGRSRR